MQEIFTSASESTEDCCSNSTENSSPASTSQELPTTANMFTTEYAQSNIQFYLLL